MAEHNPPYLIELDGNKDPVELFEVGDHLQGYNSEHFLEIDLKPSELSVHSQ